MLKKIPFGKPIIGEKEREAMSKILHGTILTHGSKCVEFENAFKNFVQVVSLQPVTGDTGDLMLTLRIRIGMPNGSRTLISYKFNA